MKLWRVFNPRTFRAQLRDAGTFGVSILLRDLLPRDTLGAITINTRLGRISLRPSDSDISVLRQVFIQKDYDISKFAQWDRVQSAYASMLKSNCRPIIIDAGANIGAASIWFSSMFPEASVLAIEPDPANAELSRRNCEARDNITIVEAAIGSVTGKVTLLKSSRRSFATQTVRSEVGVVPVVTIGDLLSEAGESSQLFIVKIDIEGFENDLFSSPTPWLSQAAVVIIEPHDRVLPGKYSSLPLQKAMFSQSFEILISGDNLVFVK